MFNLEARNEDIEILTLMVKMEGKAVNVIMFNVRGLNLFSGKLVIEASFTISSKSVKPPFFLCFSDKKQNSNLIIFTVTYFSESRHSVRHLNYCP